MKFLDPQLDGGGFESFWLLPARQLDFSLKFSTILAMLYHPHYTHEVFHSGFHDNRLCILHHFYALKSHEVIHVHRWRMMEDPRHEVV